MTVMTTKTEPTLEEIILAFQRDVWRFLVAMGCRHVEADDLTQETFVSVLRGRFTYRGEAETRSFLFTVAKRLFISSIRGRKRVPLVANLDDADIEWDRFSAECPVDARVDAMRECLRQIEGRSQTALMMRYRDDAGVEEIAAELELEPEGAKTLLRRLRDRLRECVDRRVARDE